MVFSSISLLTLRDAEKTPLDYPLTEDQGSWFGKV